MHPEVKDEDTLTLTGLETHPLPKIFFKNFFSVTALMLKFLEF